MRGNLFFILYAEINTRSKRVGLGVCESGSLGRSVAVVFIDVKGIIELPLLFLSLVCNTVLTGIRLLKH